MYGVKDRVGKISPAALRRLILLVVIIVAALILMPAAGVLAAQGSMGGFGSINGKIVAMNTSGATKTLTIQANQQGRQPYELNIFLHKTTPVMACRADLPLNDVKVGDHALVVYHELAGLAVANNISTKC